MTLRELLQEGARFLVENEIESAASEAEWLLAHTLGKDRIYVYAHGQEQTSAQINETYFDYIKRRATGEPLQYILGTSEFMGLSLKVDPRVLIPRPETEQLVELALAGIDAAGRGQASLLPVLDLCTGSGAIAIAIARLSECAAVTAVDLCGQALDVARENARINDVSQRIEFLQGDLFDALCKTDPVRFDIIVTNPPYVVSTVIDTLSDDVQSEPRLALDGGADGLSVIRRIIESAPDYLNPGGLLLMEIGYDQGKSVQELADAQQMKAYKEAYVLQDAAGFDRILLARLAK